jgi:hypothetical protein
MADFLDLLSNNPEASMVFSIVLGIIVLFLTLTYTIAFFQGREISFWPPKIGAVVNIDKPLQSSQPIMSRHFPEANVQKEALENAHIVYFWGLSFERMIPNLQKLLLQRLQAGAEIKFILLEPNSAASRMASMRHPLEKNEALLNSVLIGSLDILQNIKAQISSPEKLQIRTVDYFPAWTIMLVDPHKSTGKLFLSLVSFNDPNEVRPSMVFTVEKNNDWILYFNDQFERIWNISQRYTNAKKA